MPYNTSEKFKAYQKRWKIANPEKMDVYRKQKRIEWSKLSDEERIEHRLKTVYHISHEEWLHMFIKQDFKCYTCARPVTTNCARYDSTRGVIDHCHKTNKIRKILCHNCNKAIGLAKENIALLERMIGYLKEHE